MNGFPFIWRRLYSIPGMPWGAKFSPMAKFTTTRNFLMKKLPQRHCLTIIAAPSGIISPLHHFNISRNGKVKDIIGGRPTDTIYNTGELLHNDQDGHHRRAGQKPRRLKPI